MMKNYNLLSDRGSTILKTSLSEGQGKEPTRISSGAKKSWLLSLAFFFLLSVGSMSYGQTILINSATDGSFEGADFASDGWTVLNSTISGGAWVQSTGAAAGFTGMKSAYITNDVTASPPPHAYNINAARVSALYRDVTIPAGESSIVLSFKWVGVGESTYDRLQVWAVPTSYTPLNETASMTTTGVAPTGRVQLGTGAIGYNGSSTWKTANITVPAAYAGTSFRLVFQWRNDASGGTNPPIAIDDVSLTSSCTGAVAIAASAVQNISATANWNALTDATNYNLRYRAVGSATWINLSGLTGTSALLTSLSASTTYEYQIMANGAVCNAFSPSVIFTTVCNPVSLPYFEGFESAIVPAFPACVSGSHPLTRSTTGSGAAPRTGSIYQNIRWTPSATKYVYSAPLTLNSGTSYDMGAWYLTDGGSGWTSIKLYANNSTSVTGATLLKTISGATNTTYQQLKGSYIPSSTGIYFFIIEVIHTSAPNDMSIDDMFAQATPNCVSPTALTTSSMTATSGTLNWTAPLTSPASGYDYYYSTVNTAPTAATIPSGSVAAGSTSAAISGLTSDTAYYFWVRSNCGGGELSAWSLGGNFLTGYCIPTGGTAYYLTDVTTTGGLTNISNPTGSNGGYADFSSTNSVSAISGQSVTLNLSTNTSTHYFYGWIDWNNDFDFNDANESLFATSSYTAGYSGTITVPAGTPAGNYRMRVANTYAGAITSCGPASNGEYEDYTFTVVAQTPCSGTPTAATIATAQSNVCVSGSVTMTATLSGSADSGLTYQWYNSAGAISGANANTYTTPILTSVESYYFKTTCTGSGLSADSNTLAITVSQPSVVSTTPGTRCGTGTVNLSATVNAGADPVWFAASTGGAPLFTGATFTTPSIAATTTYYVAASEGATLETAAKATTSGADGSYILANYGIVFSATTNMSLQSTVIYPTGSGTVTIALYDSAGVELATTSAIAVTGSGISTPVTVPLNFTVAPGTGYRLLLKAYTGISGLVRDFSNSFPYNSANTSVTGGWTGSASTAYYFFYNLQVATGCASARTAVMATVTTPPAFTLSAATATICANASSTVTMTAGASDYDTFVWSPSTGVVGNSTTGWTFNPTTTTTYTLTGTQTAGTLCGATANYEVIVNPLPSALSVSPSASSTCVNSIQTLTAVGGTIAISGKIGAGTTSNTLSTPFKNNWGGSKSQALYTAAELTAMGMQAGQKISSIGYVTLNGSAVVFNEFTISAGFVSSSTIGTSFIGGATNTVLSSTVYTHNAPGNSDFTLSTPLLWDGVSSLLVETCFNNNNSGTGSSVAVESSTVSSGLNLYLSQDNNTTVCSSTSSPNSSTTRPNLRISAVLNADITWSPTTNLYTDAAATVPYTGTIATTVYAKSATAGSQTYTVTATILATGCSRTATATVTSTVTDAPTATAQTFCSGATVANLVATGTAIQWYSVAAGGTALANTAALATGTYYASQTLTACESARTSVAVTVNTTDAPTALAQTFCNGATVADLVATGTSVKWYSAATGGTPLTNTAALATGTYYVSQTLNVCESARTPVIVTVNTTAAPTASAQTFCIEGTIADLTATGTSIQWYSNATGGTALANTAALATGTYYASQTLNTCESTRTSVMVTVNTTDAPTAVAQTFCMGATVADLVATGTDIQWYAALTGGTALANTAALATGTYYASQTVNACESARSMVEVVVNALPTATITRMDDTLTATEENATYQWVLCDAASTPITGATSQSYTATAVGSYAVMVTQNGCTTTSDCFEVTTLSIKAFDAAKLGYYPNPVTDVLTVSHTDLISSIQVFDITGRLVRKMNVNSNEVKIDMANMPASVYIVKVFMENTSGEFKVIKK